MLVRRAFIAARRYFAFNTSTLFPVDLALRISLKRNAAMAFFRLHSSTLRTPGLLKLIGEFPLNVALNLPPMVLLADFYTF